LVCFGKNALCAKAKNSFATQSLRNQTSGPQAL
jgi:hypothetical protein